MYPSLLPSTHQYKPLGCLLNWLSEEDYSSRLVGKSVQSICKLVIFELFRRLPCTPFIQNGHFEASQASTGLAESRIWKGIQIRGESDGAWKTRWFNLVRIVLTKHCGAWPVWSWALHWQNCSATLNAMVRSPWTSSGRTCKYLNIFVIYCGWFWVLMVGF